MFAATVFGSSVRWAFLTELAILSVHCFPNCDKRECVLGVMGCLAFAPAALSLTALAMSALHSCVDEALMVCCCAAVQ